MRFITTVIFLLALFTATAYGADGAVKQWSVEGKVAFLGVMQNDCLKDANTCEDGFTISMWIKTFSPAIAVKKAHSGDSDTRNIGAYLVSNGGQSLSSNGFYVRRTTAVDEYEVGVAHLQNLWRIFVYLKPQKIVHFVFSWIANEGLSIYVDGLLAAHQTLPEQREYIRPQNSSIADPNPQFVANGDSLMFNQLFDEKTMLPAFDFSATGHVINVSYYHTWKSDLEVGEMTADYKDRLVAGCFFEIPFGAELISTLNNYSTNDSRPANFAYYQCRNDCVMKKSAMEPWTPWLAIIDPWTYNCYCMLLDRYLEADQNKLNTSICNPNLKQTKAQFTTVALLPPPVATTLPFAADLVETVPIRTVNFSILVPSMKCFFVINGRFPSYEKASNACRRRGATLAGLTNEADEIFIQSQLNWDPLVGRNLSQHLVWIQSPNPLEHTCNFCADNFEDCAFITNMQRNKCGCQCVGFDNETTAVKNIVGALCEKIAFDMPTDPTIGMGFCGVPAVSERSINTFVTVGETLKTFFVIPGKMNWDEAVEACENWHVKGFLAAIRSSEENNAVQRELHAMWLSRTELVGKIEPVWIGARRPAPHRPSFVWLDGTPVSFTAWALGEPSNDIQKNVPEGLKGEECVGIWPNWSLSAIQMARGWNDFNCYENRTANFGALCETYASVL